MVVDGKYLYVNGKELFILADACGYVAGRKGLSNEQTNSENVVFEINIENLTCKVRFKE